MILKMLPNRLTRSNQLPYRPSLIVCRVYEIRDVILEIPRHIRHIKLVMLISFNPTEHVTVIVP